MSFKKIIKIIFIILLIFLKNENNIITRKKKKHELNINIFTFWEPHESMPGYLVLCIKTWKKYLPKYEIKILDYKSSQDYLGRSLFSSIICKKMTLPVQVDAIRVAILQKFGGIWLDADTIILNDHLFKKLRDFELIMLGDEKKKTQNIGFIFARNNSVIIKQWLEEIIKNVHIYKQSMKKSNINNTTLNSWYYLGNGIVNRLVNNFTGKQFIRLNRDKIKALPELIFFKNTSHNAIEKYQKLYFQKGDPKIIINNSKSIIMLHNSWTPSKYKGMSENEFLNQDILLSKLLAYLLNKKI